MKELQFVVNPSHLPIHGRVKVPGDKSISHRAIMLGSLTDGETHVSGFLNGDDCLATLQAFQQMGVEINQIQDTEISIQGVGLQGLKAPSQSIDVGNAGTAIRLMAGVMAAQPFDAVLTGDASLNKRPMRRVTDPLTKMGAKIEPTESGTPPLRVTGNQTLKGIDYALPIASAQVKSCLLLAGMYATGETTITEPAPTRDHTERMLQTLGYSVSSDNGTVSLSGSGNLSAADIVVPGDISSAAFLMVAACITPDSDLVIESVGTNPTRTGIIDILKQMGADIRLENERHYGAEPVADIHVKYAALKGIDIPPSLVPLAIDEFPCLFVAAACAQGTTTLTGAEELRAKESDRIQSMADALLQFGIDAEPTPDGMIIKGSETPFTGQISAQPEIITHHDHRIAMSMSLAGLLGAPRFVIRDAQFVQTSFPGYVRLMQSLGMRIDTQTSS